MSRCNGTECIRSTGVRRPRVALAQANLATSTGIRIDHSRDRGRQLPQRGQWPAWMEPEHTFSPPSRHQPPVVTTVQRHCPPGAARQVPLRNRGAATTNGRSPDGSGASGLLAAGPVVIAVKGERVRRQDPDRTLHVVGPVARTAGAVVVTDLVMQAHIGIGRVAVVASRNGGGRHGSRRRRGRMCRSGGSRPVRRGPGRGWRHGSGGRMNRRRVGGSQCRRCHLRRRRACNPPYDEGRL